ncbi:hypothetical protein FYK55_20430 [Roseiconus nitratireducens]|uniref:Uncharacterized protein n=1 Tax=Roseiconus nitratireducens TaxID=2605748 RepID=A0A5M6CYU5_9BACT|nr:hypothetical protein [Roseiconus nitratireducens]KAA5540391.1 hypothetical protein FYK55_20430 [Roseiconus nitratireducens]
MDEQETTDRPRWLTDELLEHAIRVFQPKSSAPFGEPEAVDVLVSLSQLLEVTGILKLEDDYEADEALHRLGEGQQS